MLEPDSIVDELVDVCVADADGFFALDVLSEAVERSETEASDNVILRVVEHFAEDDVLVRLVFVTDHAQSVGRMVEEELGSCVDSKHKEELLEVNRGAVLWDVLEHELEVALECFEISDLITGKIRSQEVTAVRPAFTIVVEDTVAQERREALRSVAKAVVLELQAENRLHVLRLAGGNDWLNGHPGVEGVAEALESLFVLLEQDVLLAVGAHYAHHIDTQDWVLVKDLCAWPATCELSEWAIGASWMGIPLSFLN